MTDVLKVNWTSEMEVTLTELLAEHRLVLAGDFGRPGDAGGLTKNQKKAAWEAVTNALQM